MIDGQASSKQLHWYVCSKDKQRMTLQEMFKDGDGTLHQCGTQLI